MTASRAVFLNIMWFGIIAVACSIPNLHPVARNCICIVSVIAIKKIDCRRFRSMTDEIVADVVKAKWDAQMSLVRSQFIYSEILKNEGPPTASDSATSSWKS